MWMLYLLEGAGTEECSLAGFDSSYSLFIHRL